LHVKWEKLLVERNVITKKRTIREIGKKQNTE